MTTLHLLRRSWTPVATLRTQFKTQSPPPKAERFAETDAQLYNRHVATDV